MAGVREKELHSLGPWPAGVNNVANERELPADENGRTIALRAAVNVDLDNAGNPSRRDGYVQRVAASRAHSLFAADKAEYMFAVVDGDLRAYDTNLSLAATVRAAIGQRYASFAQVVDDTYWSNGIEIRRITLDLEDLPVWLPNPPAPAGSATASGGLAAGTYFVCLTWIGDDGRESGASNDAVVDVAANGGIALTLPGIAAQGAARIRVYCSSPNDDTDTAYFVADLPATQPMFVIGAHAPGKSCETKQLVPLPPGQIVRFWNGSVLVAAGNMLCWGVALRFGLMHQDSALRIGADITLMEPVGEGGAGGGVFVADHKRTYFMEGDALPGRRKVVYGHPAVPGTGITLPANVFGGESTMPIAVWLAANGVWCKGFPTGVVEPIREGELAMLNDSEHGATMYREVKGLRQLMTSFLAGGALTMGATDSAVATVRRNGVTLD